MVDALNQNEGHSMVATPVLEDCCTILVDFGKVNIEHCITELNYVAHELARWGCANNPFLWVNSTFNYQMLCVITLNMNGGLLCCS